MIHVAAIKFSLSSHPHSQTNSYIIQSARFGCGQGGTGCCCWAGLWTQGLVCVAWVILSTNFNMRWNSSRSWPWIWRGSQSPQNKTILPPNPKKTSKWHGNQWNFLIGVTSDGCMDLVSFGAGFCSDDIMCWLLTEQKAVMLVSIAAHNLKICKLSVFLIV